MKTARRFALLTTLGLTAAVALPRQYADEDDERPQRKQHLPPAGFWPTETMMERFIDRITEDMGEAYDFDEDQLYNTRELWKERFPTWLNENRAEIMEVTNEYIEALLDGEPPDAGYVADWAQRALPLFDGFTDVFEDVSEDMRTYMTEEQEVILDGHVAAFRTGMSFMNQRLGVWSEGGFDAETEWPGSPGHREAEREREQEVQEAIRQAELEARGELVEAPDGSLVAPAEVRPAAAPKPAAQPRDEWTKYVEDFVRHYQLNDEQQTRAFKALRFQQEQRDKYLRRTGDRLARAKAVLAAAENEEERAVAQERHEKLTRPLGRMFTQLKEKLDKLPTRKQRVAAAQTKAEAAQTEQQGTTAPATDTTEERSPGSP